MNKRSRPRKSWREKFENPPKELPKVVDGPPEWRKRFGGRRVLVPTPLLVDGLIARVQKRKLVTVKQIRERLAKDFDAESTCPLTTGILLRIVAEVSEGDKELGKRNRTPYWRVIKSDDSLNLKFPGGIKAQTKHLEQEGHIVLPYKGKSLPKVEDFEKYLQEL